MTGQWFSLMAPADVNSHLRRRSPSRSRLRRNRSQTEKVANMSNVLKSRKFYAALIALLLVFFGERAGVSGEALTQAIYVLIAYITGTALEDGLRGRN